MKPIQFYMVILKMTVSLFHVFHCLSPVGLCCCIALILGNSLKVLNEVGKKRTIAKWRELLYSIGAANHVASHCIELGSILATRCGRMRCGALRMRFRVHKSSQAPRGAVYITVKTFIIIYLYLIMLCSTLEL